MIESFLLGCVQGFSEFLPLSSSGHLAVIKHYFASNSQTFTMILVLHLGTLFSILGYYGKPILSLIRVSLTDPFNPFGPAKPFYLLMCACIPSAGGALLLYSLVKQSVLEFLGVGVGFFLTGCLLFSTRLVLKNHAKNHLLPTKNFAEASHWEHFHFFKAFLIGLIQVIAFFPGFSRSGWTISMALFLSVPRNIAVFFSFLLSIPTIIGGAAVEIFSKDFEWSLSLVCAFFTSWISGLCALHFLIRVVNSTLFPFFAFYLWLLSFFILLF